MIFNNKILKFSLITFFLLGLLKVEAQDIHFTLFDRSPLTLNPAYSGGFKGNYRIGGIHRDQWRNTLGGNSFSTQSVFADIPLIEGLKKGDWLGVGVSIFNDKAGSVGLGSTAVSLAASYHLSLDKNRKHIIALGVQGGLVSRKWNNNESARFGDEALQELEGNIYESTDRNINVNTNYVDLSVGLTVNSTLSKRLHLNLGLAFFHLNQPTYGFQTSTDQQLPLRLVTNGQLTINLNQNWNISPKFLFQKITSAQETIAQIWGGYSFNSTNGLVLKGGIGSRFNDASQILLGANYKAFDFAFSYDINTSSLNNSVGSTGAFEIALSYIARKYKRPKVYPKILCPRL